MRRQNDLGKDPIPSLVLKLAIPSMIAQFVNILYSIIDRIYIGNIPETGALALAGVGVCGPIVTLLSSFGTLIGLGGSILVAMRMGEKNQKQAEKILANSFVLLVIFSAVLTILFLIFKNRLLMCFGASETTFPYANTYLSIYTIGTFFALMAMGLNYFITCQGYSTIGMVTVLLGAVTNIVLDPVFIFLLHMDTAGAAIATVISQMVSCLFAAGFLLSKRPPVRITFGGYSLSICRRILSIGISPFLILATDSVIIIIMNSVLQRAGGTDGDLLIASATIVQSFLSLITGPMLGISSGTQAIISYNYGANLAGRIKQAEKNILILCLIFTTLMFIVSRIFPYYFVRVFTSSPKHIELSVWGIKAITLAVIPLSFQYCLVDCLTALGCTKISLSLSLFRKSLYTSFVIIFAFAFQAKTSFFAEPASDLIASAMSTAAFLLVFKKHLEKRNKQIEASENKSAAIQN